MKDEVLNVKLNQPPLCVCVYLSLSISPFSSKLTTESMAQDKSVVCLSNASMVNQR